VKRELVSAVILAGGLSTRFGRDKAPELLLGRSLLQRVIDRLAGLVDEYVVVTAAGQTLPHLEASLPIEEMQDLYPRVGPLGGLYSGMSVMRHLQAIAVACDMPLLQPALLSELLRLLPGHDAVVPLTDAGLPEPLCAAYSIDCLPALLDCIDQERYKLTSFFEDVDVLYVQPAVWRAFDREGLSFLNVNREEDLRRAEALLTAESS
jgi:molybdopterin-guanine dinucleotide biosynthesis protein A